MNRIPKYPSKPDSFGRVRVKFKGRHYYLPGKIGSPESIAEYARLVAEFAAGVPKLSKATPITVSELIAKWIKDDPRGAEHPQVVKVARACIPLDRLFGATRADEFTAARLEIVQTAMVNGSWGEAERWSVGYINQCVNCIRRIFRRAEFLGLVPRGTWEHLRTLPPLGPKATGAKVNQPRTACDWESQVVPILPFVSPAIATMLELQMLAGLRPSEALNMKRGEIDRTSEPGCWLYRPAEHKGSWRGSELVKFLGPRAQAILSPWLLRCPDDDCSIFRPASNSRRPYGPDGYAKAVRRACERAGVKAFTPYQLRHLAKQRVARECGLDAARAILGHTSMGMTADYSREVDKQMGSNTARKIG